MKKVILFFLFIPLMVAAQKGVNLSSRDSLEVFDLYSKGAKILNKQPDSAKILKSISYR